MNKTRLLLLSACCLYAGLHGVSASASSYLAEVKGVSRVAVSQEASAAWAVTATAFKLVGEKSVNNVKVDWMQRPDADTYKVYRDGKLIGEAIGDTFDDYGLPVGKTFNYYVEAYKDGKKVATAEAQKASTFTPEGNLEVYDNRDGKTTGKTTARPSGMLIGGTYYSYKIETQGGKKNILESHSKTGMPGSWSAERVIASYPADQKFEGVAFRFNKKTGKVVLSAHYEDAQGYTAAKIFLAQITPKGNMEVGTADRPLGHESRDQSLFIDDDGTAYLLSAANNNRDINIYRLDPTWTKVEKLVNTICKDKHRETPAIIKRDGEYYFFSSKASGWYPSQTMYASATDLGGQWTELREIGNNSTFDAQFNNIQTRGKDRLTYGVWSYHWGAQRHHKTPEGNFPRISVAAFNKGYASMDYYRYIEFSDKYGLIPVQNGRNLTQGKPVSAKVVSNKGVKPSSLTDGADLTSSAYFQKSANSPVGTPYMFVIDMQKPSQINEINLSTNLVNGSEAAYKFTIEGSADGEKYTMLVDGRSNWGVGFLVLPVEDKSAYRYIRFRVYGVVGVQKNNAAMWADGIYELAAYGTEVK